LTAQIMFKIIVVRVNILANSWL